MSSWKQLNLTMSTSIDAMECLNFTSSESTTCTIHSDINIGENDTDELLVSNLDINATVRAVNKCENNTETESSIKIVDSQQSYIDQNGVIELGLPLDETEKKQDMCINVNSIHTKEIEEPHVHFGTPLSVYHEYKISQSSSQTESIASECCSTTRESLCLSQDIKAEEKLEEPDIEKCIFQSSLGNVKLTLISKPVDIQNMNSQSQEEIHELSSELVDIITDVKDILDHLIIRCCESVDENKCKLNHSIIIVDLSEELIPKNVTKDKLPPVASKEMNSIFNPENKGRTSRLMIDTHTDNVSRYDIYESDTMISQLTDKKELRAQENFAVKNLFSYNHSLLPNDQIATSDDEKSKSQKPEITNGQLDVLANCSEIGCDSQQFGSSGTINPTYLHNGSQQSTSNNVKYWAVSEKYFVASASSDVSGLVSHSNDEPSLNSNIMKTPVSYAKQVEIIREQNAVRMQKILFQPLLQTFGNIILEAEERNCNDLSDPGENSTLQRSNEEQESFEIFDTEDEDGSENESSVKSVSHHNEIAETSPKLLQETSELDKIEISHSYDSTDKKVTLIKSNFLCNSEFSDNLSNSDSALTEKSSYLSFTDPKQNEVGETILYKDDSMCPKSDVYWGNSESKESMDIKNNSQNASEKVDNGHFFQSTKEFNLNDKTLTSTKVKEGSDCDALETQETSNSQIKVYGVVVRKKLTKCIGDSVLDQCIYESQKRNTLSDQSNVTKPCIDSLNKSTINSERNTSNSREKTNQATNEVTSGTKENLTNHKVIEEERSYCLNSTMIDHLERTQDILPNITSPENKNMAANVSFDKLQTNESLKIDRDKPERNLEQNNLSSISERSHSEQLNKKQFGMHLIINQNDLELQVRENSYTSKNNKNMLNEAKNDNLFCNELERSISNGRKRLKEEYSVQGKTPYKVPCFTKDDGSIQLLVRDTYNNLKSEEKVDNSHETIPKAEEDQSVPEMTLPQISDEEENYHGMYSHQQGITGQTVFKWTYAPSIELDSVVPNVDNEDISDTSFIPHPLKTCKKPYRTGLSKKQKLSSLHPKLKTV